MTRRFNMGDAAAILGTNPKTFKNWLIADGIDIENQLNRADSREKYVTDEQLLAMGKKRDIEVHLPEERKSESTSARILAGIDERFTKLDQQLAGRVDQLAAEIPAMLTDLRRNLEQQLTHHFDQIDARLAQVLAESQRARASAPPQERPHAPTPRARTAPSASTPSTLTAAPPKPTAKKRGKRKTKAKELPRGFIPLSVFKSEHGISNKAVEYAMEKQKLAVKRGKWLHSDRNVMIALDAQGRQQFYELFHERQGFQRCEQCPHAAGAK